MINPNLFVFRTEARSWFVVVNGLVVLGFSIAMLFIDLETPQVWIMPACAGLFGIAYGGFCVVWHRRRRKKTPVDPAA